MSDEQLVALAIAMVDAFVKTGRVKPVLPDGRRDDVVRCCLLLLTEPGALDVYLTTIKAEQQRQGVQLRLWPLVENGVEVETAEETIPRLSDDDLACFAFVPDACLSIPPIQEDFDEGLLD